MEFTHPENKLTANLKTFKDKVLNGKVTIEQTMQYFVKFLKSDMREEQLDIPEGWNTGIEEMLQNPDDPNNENIMDNLIKQLARANGIIVLGDEDLDDEDIDEEHRKYIEKEYSEFEKKVLDSLFKAINMSQFKKKVSDSLFKAINYEPDVAGGKRRKTRKRGSRKRGSRKRGKHMRKKSRRI
jgi:hypothetical protein